MNNESAQKILDICDLLVTQDNRITESPFFIVQQCCRDYGYSSDYSDTWIWVKSGGYDCDEIASDALAEILDNLDPSEDRPEEFEEYEKRYFSERWEYVTGFLTEKAATAYCESEKHNLKQTRVWADSLYRNAEMTLIRNYLISISNRRERQKSFLARVFDILRGFTRKTNERTENDSKENCN